MRYEAKTSLALSDRTPVILMILGRILQDVLLGPGVGGHVSGDRYGNRSAIIEM